jgi:hypothetical protein
VFRRERIQTDVAVDMTNGKILFFVEDPGAANYLDGIIAEAQKNNITTTVVAEGKAREQFLNRYNIAPLQKQDRSAASILETYQPTIVVVGTAVNPDTMGLQLVSESRRRGLATLGAVDCPGNEEWRFRGRGGGPLENAPDKILVPDDPTRRAFIDLGASPSSVFACGSPHFDFVHQKRETFSITGRSTLREEILSEVVKNRRVVVCAPDPIGGVNPQEHVRNPEYTLHGRGDSDQRPDIFIQEFLDAMEACEGPRPYLVLRLHPRSRAQDFTVDLSSFDEISQGGEALALLYCADLVVGLTSILIVEATLLGTPTLSITPRAKEAAWLSTIEMKLTPMATTREEIRQLLPSAMKAPRLPINEVKTAFPTDCASRALDIITNDNQCNQI